MAQINFKQFGYTKTIIFCVLLIGQCLLVHIPYLVLAYLKRNKVEIIDRKCLLWQTSAYTRKTLFLLAPQAFPQRKYFDQLEFRKSREIFPKDFNSK